MCNGAARGLLTKTSLCSVPAGEEGEILWRFSNLHSKTLLCSQAAIQSTFNSGSGMGQHRSVKNQICYLVKTLLHSLLHIAAIFCQHHTPRRKKGEEMKSKYPHHNNSSSSSTSTLSSFLLSPPSLPPPSFPPLFSLFQDLLSFCNNCYSLLLRKTQTETRVQVSTSSIPPPPPFITLSLSLGFVCGLVPAATLSQLPASITSFNPTLRSTVLTEIPANDIHTSTEDWITM